MMLLLFVIIIVLFLIVSLYIKIKYRFWTLQPVFHKYNLLYRIGKKMRIITETVTMNRYVNIIDIKTQKVSEITKTERERIVDFIKTHLVQTNIFTYSPKEINIFPYLEYSNHCSCISIYNRPTYAVNNNSIQPIKEYIGLLTGRPVNVIIKKNRVATYYLDNLSIDTGYKENDTTCKLIQTHIYNTLKINNKIKTFLFKHYNKPPILKSLTSFYIVGYDITKLPTPKTIHASYSFIELGTLHFSILHSFVQNQIKLYDCVIIPELSNIYSLIKTKNIILYGSIKDGELIALYIFKNTAMHLHQNDEKSTDDNKYENPNTLLCICSLIDIRHTNTLYAGFLKAVYKCVEKLNIKYIFLETVTNNKNINNFLKKYSSSIVTKKGHYVLYNYISPYINPERCFLLL